MGAGVTGLSSAAATVSGGALIGLSSVAYYSGLAAVWTGIALVAGTLVNWLYVAPRLRALSLVHDSLSMTRVLANDTGERMHRRVAWSSACIVTLSLLLLASMQLRVAGSMMELTFHWRLSTATLCALALVVAYTAVGGLLSISLLGAIHAVVTLCIVFTLTAFAINAVGGVGALLAAVAEMKIGDDSWFGTRSGVAALAFVLGTLGPGLGLSGQPALTHRLMALREPTLALRAGTFAICWTVLIVICALTIGWCAKVLIAELGPFDVLTELAARRLPATLAVPARANRRKVRRSTRDASALPLERDALGMVETS